MVKIRRSHCLRRQSLNELVPRRIPGQNEIRRVDKPNIEEVRHQAKKIGKVYERIHSVVGEVKKIFKKVVSIFHFFFWTIYFANLNSNSSLLYVSIAL